MLPFFSLPPSSSPLSSPLPSPFSISLVYKFWHDNFFCYKCMTPNRRSAHHLIFLHSTPGAILCDPVIFQSSLLCIAFWCFFSVGGEFLGRLFAVFPFFSYVRCRIISETALLESCCSYCTCLYLFIMLTWSFCIFSFSLLQLLSYFWFMRILIWQLQNSAVLYNSEMYWSVASPDSWPQLFFLKKNLSLVLERM